jgi:hypothetical protein
MSTVSSGKTNSHDNPDEPRDERGRWTTGGSSWRANPVRRPGPAGRAHLLLGHALTSAWHQGLIREFKLPTEDEAGRFARTLRTWNAASDLDPETFRENFTRSNSHWPVWPIFSGWAGVEVGDGCQKVVPCGEDDIGSDGAQVLEESV